MLYTSLEAKDSEKLSSRLVALFSTCLVLGAFCGISSSIFMISRFSVPVQIYVLAMFLDTFTMVIGLTGYLSIFLEYNSTRRYLLSVFYAIGSVIALFTQVVRLSLCIYATYISVFSSSSATRDREWKNALYIVFGALLCAVSLSSSCCIGSAFHHLKQERERVWNPNTEHSELIISSA